MKKILISFIGVLCTCMAMAAGENVPTSKSFVDAAVAHKQNKIPANSGTAAVLTNTGVAGNVGTKNIYDSSVPYAGQQDNLVDAGTFNAAMQNAIDAEFKCISWVDDDPTKDCLLLEIFGTTSVQHPYVSATGTVSQNGTPTPEHLVEPVFYRQGDMVLRRVGDYADSYDATTGQITRRVGVLVLKGTEYWTLTTSSAGGGDYSANPYFTIPVSDALVSAHLQPTLCNILTSDNIMRHTQKRYRVDITPLVTYYSRQMGF